MRFVDPDGMEIHIIGENDSITIYNTNTTYEGADGKEGTPREQAIEQETR